MTTMRTYDDLDVSTLGFWALDADARERTFAELRQRPLSWHAPAEGGMLPPVEGDGFWAVVRHRDVKEVSRNPQLFASGPGVMLEDIPQDLVDAAHSFLAMDAPRHTLLRRLVSSAFTPRRVKVIEEQIARQAHDIVADLSATLTADGETDFVRTVARRLPMWTISEMMGVAPEERDSYAEAANAMVGWNDPTMQDGRDPLGVILDSLFALHAMSGQMAAARREHPADDVMTALVQAEVDGVRLADDEIAAFFVLLAVAGNDTTRNTISHGIRALCDFPDQRRLLVEHPEHLATATEEMVRWASPVMTFRRTATEDTALDGVPIEAGEKVVLFYGSANRDDEAFVDPHRFDITRTPNDHVGFGGGGPHFCMGASVARSQLRSIFTELLQQVPTLQVGEPTFLVGNFIHGITTMPCSATMR